MDLPSSRIREVLGVLRDLHPSEARVLLGQVVATLDAAEIESLRRLLPSGLIESSGLIKTERVLAISSRPASEVGVGQPSPSTRHAGAEVRGFIDAPTMMNEAPMPWELNPAVPPPAFRSEVGFETGEIIRAAVPRPSRRLGVVIAALASLVLGLILAVIFVPAADQEAAPRPVVAPRPARVAPVKTVEGPAPAPAKPQPAPAKPAVRKGKKSPVVKSADWASPFDRRY